MLLSLLIPNLQQEYVDVDPIESDQSNVISFRLFVLLRLYKDQLV